MDYKRSSVQHTHRTQQTSTSCTLTYTNICQHYLSIFPSIKITPPSQSAAHDKQIRVFNQGKSGLCICSTGCFPLLNFFFFFFFACVCMHAWMCFFVCVCVCVCVRARMRACLSVFVAVVFLAIWGCRVFFQSSSSCSNLLID